LVGGPPSHIKRKDGRDLANVHEWKETPIKLQEARQKLKEGKKMKKEGKESIGESKKSFFF